ncbi:MAG: zinc ribbon domain-containing protein [Defluviitaleaceae bacterium]|nr:zinc ribbon domain-containing protein [Defluviitaleaceae bacterium]
MKCEKCGATYTEDSKFCGSCGEVKPEAAAPTAEDAPPAPPVAAQPAEAAPVEITPTAAEPASSGSPLRFIAPAAAILIIAIIGVVFFMNRDDNGDTVETGREAARDIARNEETPIETANNLTDEVTVNDLGAEANLPAIADAIAEAPTAAPTPTPAEITDVAEATVTAADGLLQSAFANMSSEMAARLRATPLYAFSLLGQAFDYGTVNLGITYTDWILSVGFDAILQQNMPEGMMHWDLGVNLMGTRLGLEIFANEYILALRTELLDDNFYGVTFETLPEDLIHFLPMLGFDQRDIDEAIEAIDAFMLYMEAVEELGLDVTWTEFFENYMGAIWESLTGIEYETTTANNYTIIAYTVQTDDIYRVLSAVLENFAGDFLEIMEALAILDDDLALDADEFREILEFSRHGLADAMEEFDGEIVIEFHIDNDGRLSLIFLHAGLVFGGDDEELILIVDFGDAITGDWNLLLSATEYGDLIDFLDITWSYAAVAGVHTNVMAFEVDGSFAEVASVWDANNGDFDILATWWDWWMADYITEFISGNFTTNNNGGFTLEFTDLERLLDLDLSIVISATQSTDFTAPHSFINMSEWDEDLIAMVLETVEALMFFLG